MERYFDNTELATLPSSFDIEAALKTGYRTLQKYSESDNFCIYNGLAGVAYLNLKILLSVEESKLGEIFGVKNRLDFARSIDRVLDTCIMFLKPRKKYATSFYFGVSGCYCLKLLLHSHLRNTKKLTKYLKELCDLGKTLHAVEANELFYGKCSYLYCLIFAKNTLQSDDTFDESVLNDVISPVALTIYAIGENQMNELDLEFLYYEWHNKCYLGGAHGLAGIYLVLLHCSEFLLKDQIRIIKRSVDTILANYKYPSNNIMSSVDLDAIDVLAKRDKLVQFCHGCVGYIPLLLKLHTLYDDVKYLDQAKAFAELIYERGLLRKGFGLCHGISGNAYAFLQLYRFNPEQNHQYLRYAMRFAAFQLEHQHELNSVPDEPYSLYNGICGLLYFLIDLRNPVMAFFPGYEVS